MAATLGDRLRDLREGRNLSMRRLAEQLGTYKKTIYTWEHNIFVPGAENLVHIAGFFDVQTDFLLYGHSETSEPPAEATRLLRRFQALTAEEKQRAIAYLELTHAVAGRDMEG